MEKENQGLHRVSAGFVLAGLVFFGLVYKFPLCILFLTGIVLTSVGIFLEDFGNSSANKAANVRLAMTAGCCFCIAAASYYLVVYLVRMGAEGLQFVLEYGYYTLLAIGRDICYVGMLICAILSIHRGWCTFTGSYLTVAYLFLRVISSGWFAVLWISPKFLRTMAVLFLREGSLLLYCVGMLLFFQRMFQRKSAECTGLAGETVIGVGQGSCGNNDQENNDQANQGYESKGSTWLKVSSIIYIVLAIIGAGATSFILVQQYLNIRGGDLHRWFQEGFMLLVVCALYDNMFYLFAGLYGVCYAKKAEKARNCMTIGWILLAGALVMLVGGCGIVINSAWLFVEVAGKLLLLPGLLRLVLAGIYLKGGKDLWKKRN